MLLIAAFFAALLGRLNKPQTSFIYLTCFGILLFLGVNQPQDKSKKFTKTINKPHSSAPLP
jgi:hypothetical protein